MSGPVSPYLAWNVKTAFRSYVEDVGGTIEVTDGAAKQQQAFLFPFVAEGDGVLKFGGAVRFSAHAGAMNLLISDPWVHVDNDGSRLSVAGTEATRTAGLRLFLAQLSTPAHGAEGADVSSVLLEAALLSEGAVAFDFRYAAGTQLDPVRHSVST
ncbi:MULTISPECIES: HtaA domain-containing protein [unclassified Salinibacterium]|uniref:HtaA domain-containing protein n=1 Tax=unclassified Salinibacterium TaxID=2632331 RepID=UPI0018CFAB99|nr:MULTISPECIES: HtaA domain-containing protein [unclassified Salinibacterium]MBH0024820.1 HtaA domain-containing protein [Salinibacterium sp. SWN248]MBH0054823.1 HtaA domain-containing protein [Salinibacterium sp. SWN139]MBH0084032.1 HtaA domain-containing protein [Salinibacterium sp. SWN167]